MIIAEEDRVASYIDPINPESNSAPKQLQLYHDVPFVVIIGSDTSREPFYHCSFATGATDHEACSYYCQYASRGMYSVCHDVV